VKAAIFRWQLLERQVVNMNNATSCSFRNAAVRVMFLCSAALLIPSLVLAQSFRGSIRGKVADPSGSLVAGAKITSKNVDTGLTRDATTTDEGTFVLAELPAGTYTVTVNAAGFAPVAQNVVVNVGLDTTADFSLLKVQQRTENITVTAEVPLVEATRDVLGEVVDQRLVADLPLNGRDFGKLVALVPGATVEPSGVAAIQSGFGQFSINGNRDRSNNYTVDGTDNNDPFFNNSAFNQTGIGGAPASLLPIDSIQEFNLQANFSPEYGRNSGSVINILTKSGTNHLHGSAFEFLRNSAMDARNYFNRAVNPGTGLPVKKTAFRNNNFGASLGGPIVKDKIFFFGAYEGQRERVGSDFSLLVPTQHQIAEAEVDAGGTVNPALVKILNYFFPNVPSAPASQPAALVPYSVKDKNDGDSLLAKVDLNLSSSENLTTRYAFARSQQTFPLGNPGTLNASRLSQFAQNSPTRVQLFSSSLLSTLGTSRVNEIRFGYSRYRTSFTASDNTLDPLATFGINFGTGKLGMPEIDFGGIFDNLGATAFSIPRGRTSQSYQILDNFIWLKGKHTVKVGAEYRRIAISSFNDNLERGAIVLPTGNGLDLNPGTDILAAYFLGSTSFTLGDMGNTQRTTYNNGLSFFAQDDFMLSPSFTVNYGMRWEYFGPISEKNNILANLGTDGQLAMVGSDGVDGAYSRDLNNFGPRVGFAWNVAPKTVVRGAYGVYFDYVPQDLMTTNFTNDAGLVTPPIGPNPVTPLTYNQSAFATAPAPGTPPAPVFTPLGPPFDIFFTPRNFETPYAQNWNLNLEQQLTKELALQLGYIGSKGTKLVRLRDANQSFPGGGRPNTSYGFMDEFANLSSSVYHGLQATLRTRNWHGVSGFAGYTWSKSIDDASDGINFVNTVALPQDSNNLRAERGPSNFDTRHRFTAAFNYALPDLFGAKRLSQGWQVNAILTAQSGRPIPLVCSCDTSGTGFPTPSNGLQRPNLVPGQPIINSNWESSPDVIGYLNGNAFAQPPSETFGTLGRNAIFGPKFWNLDFAVLKDTRLHERLTLQLRAEFFNIFNHPNFALPGFSITPGSNDVITQTPDQAQTNPGLGGGGPRVIQLGAKFLF
jgi:hypothetical protein